MTLLYLSTILLSKVAAKGLSYAKLSTEKPKGWSDDDIHLAKCHGFSQAGIHYLKPCPERYNAAGLIQIKDEVTPHLLDPNLKAFQEMYVLGNCEAIGFYALGDLVPRRQNSLLEKGNLVKE